MMENMKQKRIVFEMGDIMLLNLFPAASSLIRLAYWFSATKRLQAYLYYYIKQFNTGLQDCEFSIVNFNIETEKLLKNSFKN